jgi:hemoglobin-like flavoprotein
LPPPGAGYRCGVTPEQIALVERTLVAVEPVLDGVAADFYRRLFAAEPAAEAMFSSELAAQRVKFVAELEQIVRSIRRHEVFLDRAGTLGAQHEEYGVRPRDYLTAGDALLAALAEALGEQWTDEVAEAWARAYDLTTAAMLAATTPAPPTLSLSRRRSD